MLIQINPIGRSLLCIALAVSAACLSACRSTEPELTATAVYELAVKDIESRRATATVVRARMQTTLEYAETRVGLVKEAGEFLRFSLNNLGTDSDFIETQISQLVDTPTPTELSPSAQTTEEASSAVTPIDPPTAVPIASSTVPTPETAPTTDNRRGRLEGIVLASGVGADDCAVDSNPRFTPESAAIYIVARAYNVPADATISSAWHRQGAEVARFSFQPERAINGNCIWFYIDQNDAAFTVGAWSVEIFVDGVSLTAPLAFQIVSG